MCCGILALVLTKCFFSYLTVKLHRFLLPFIWCIKIFNNLAFCSIPLSTKITPPPPLYFRRRRQPAGCYFWSSVFVCNIVIEHYYRAKVCCSHYETFKIDRQWYIDDAIKFARWQHLAVLCCASHHLSASCVIYHRQRRRYMFSLARLSSFVCLVCLFVCLTVSK